MFVVSFANLKSRTFSCDPGPRVIAWCLALKCNLETRFLTEILLFWATLNWCRTTGKNGSLPRYGLIHSVTTSLLKRFRAFKHCSDLGVFYSIFSIFRSDTIFKIYIFLFLSVNCLYFSHDFIKYLRLSVAISGSCQVGFQYNFPGTEARFQF